MTLVDKQVVRALYKSCLLTGRRLIKELKRQKTTDIFSQNQVVWLQKNVPFLLRALPYSDSLYGVIADEFRRNSDINVGEKLDIGFQAVSLINQRLSLLERHAVDCTSSTLTNGIRVSIRSQSLPNGISSFLFSYKVTIKNESFPEPVQLISREWQITDFEGHVQKVSGPGVIGMQPTVEKGEEFEYSSFATLQCRKGTMEGKYHMLARESEKMFDVNVGPLALN